MKKAGVVGGIGPSSTMDYYTGIINGCGIKTNGENYPEIVINSIDMTKMLYFVQTGDNDGLAGMLLTAIKELANAGAEFATIASNTPHIVFDILQRRSILPLVSIVEAACRYAEREKYKKIAVIGTKFIMDSGLYPDAFEKRGVIAITPSEEQQRVIHNLFFPNLENGIVVAEDKKKMLELVNGFIAENKADSLLLGCTELPLMIKDGDAGVPLINTTQLHIDAIVEQIIDNR